MPLCPRETQQPLLPALPQTTVTAQGCRWDGPNPGLSHSHTQHWRMTPLSTYSFHLPALSISPVQKCCSSPEQGLSHSVAHMLALPRPITSAEELLAALTKPAADFSVLWYRFLLTSFLFLFSSLQGCILRSCSSALPKPEPLSTPISANCCEQHLNPT